MTVESTEASTESAASTQQLTTVEIKILVLVAAGLSGVGIATTLCVPIERVADVLESVRGRLGVPSTAQAVEDAKALGLLDGIG